MTPKYDDQEDKKKSTTQAKELTEIDNWIVQSKQVRAILPKIKSGLDKERYSVACHQLVKSNDNKEIVENTNIIAGILSKNGFTESQIKSFLSDEQTGLLTFVKAGYNTQIHLVNQERYEDARKLRDEIQSGEVSNYSNLRGWVKDNAPEYLKTLDQERKSFLDYLSLIADLVSRFLPPAQNLDIQNLSVLDQITATDKFIDELIKKKEKDKAEREESSEEHSEEGRKTKRDKKEAFEKMMAGKTAEIEIPSLELRSEDEKMKSALEGEALAVSELKIRLEDSDEFDIKTVQKDKKFQTLFDDNREKQLIKLFKDIVPSKRADVANFARKKEKERITDLSKYSLPVQYALVSAYRESLEDYSQKYLT